MSPEDGSSGVAAGTQARATFSERLDASSVATSTFSLRTAAGAPVPASVAYDAASRTATLTPSAPLSAGSYSATVQGVQDLAANTLASPRTWTFTAGAPATPGRGPGTEPYDRPAGSVRGTSIAAHKLRIGPKRARVSRRGASGSASAAPPGRLVASLCGCASVAGRRHAHHDDLGWPRAVR